MGIIMESITKSKWKSFLLQTISIIIIAVGIYFFKFANNFTFGGITGLAVLVAKLGWLSASNFTFVANITLLLIGSAILGKKFAIKTAYCSLLLSTCLAILEHLYPLKGPLTNEPLLELAFAIALPSFGSAILFNLGSSSGGTDVVAMILKKYTTLDIGRALLATDVIITSAGCLMFGVTNGLYSFLGLAIRSFMIDNFIESFNLSKYFNVVCKDPTPICDYILNDIKRGATVCEAKGAFAGDDRYIIFTALNRVQAVRLRNYIKETEPGAFILISNTSEIIGKGFHSI